MVYTFLDLWMCMYLYTGGSNCFVTCFFHLINEGQVSKSLICITFGRIFKNLLIEIFKHSKVEIITLVAIGSWLIHCFIYTCTHFSSSLFFLRWVPDISTNCWVCLSKLLLCRTLKIIQMNFFTKQKQTWRTELIYKTETDLENELTVTRQEGLGRG